MHLTISASRASVSASDMRVRLRMEPAASPPATCSRTNSLVSRARPSGRSGRSCAGVCVWQTRCQAVRREHDRPCSTCHDLPWQARAAHARQALTGGRMVGRRLHAYGRNGGGVVGVAVVVVGRWRWKGHIRRPNQQRCDPKSIPDPLWGHNKHRHRIIDLTGMRERSDAQSLRSRLRQP